MADMTNNNMQLLSGYGALQASKRRKKRPDNIINFK